MSMISLFLSYAFANTMTAAEYVAAPANPINVKVELGNTQNSALISAKNGGSVRLVTSQGDTVELVFPKAALEKDTTITMLEIKNIQSSRLGNLDSQRSIQLKPEGLELLKPAVLTFKLKKALDLKKSVAIYSTGPGDDLSFATRVGSSTEQEIKLGIAHFSNYGIFESLTADEIIANGFTQMSKLRLTNWINHQIEKAKKTDGDVSHIADRAFSEGFKQIVYPAMKNATSCKATELASQHFVSWMRQVQILGGNTDDYMEAGTIDELTQVLSKNLTNCFPDLVKACYQDHRPIEVMQQIFWFLRSVALLGGENPMANSPAKEFFELQEKCSHFRFFMKSEFWVGDTREDGHGITAESDFKFKLNPFQEGPITGEINVTDLVLNAQDFICERTVFETQPAQLMIKPDFFKEIASGQPGQNITIAIGNLVPLNSGVFMCRTEDGQSGFEYPLTGPQLGSYWGGMWIATHGPTGLNEMQPDAFFNLKNWQFRNDKRWLHKTYVHSVEHISETTEITIYHEPEMPPPTL